MPEETPVPSDSPIVIAWNAYKATPEFSNTRYWALRPDYTNGSLWAAFVAGWQAAQHGHEAELPPIELDEDVIRSLNQH